jgi:hypothetical protein
MRIGIRLTPDAMVGAAFSAGEEVARSSLKGCSDAILRSLLHSLLNQGGRQRGHGLTVAFDLDSLLTEHVIGPTDEVEGGTVLLVLVAPRPPSHPALLRHPYPLVARHAASVVSVRGGHTVTGAELAPLDESTVRDIASRLNAGEFGDTKDVAVVAAGGLTSPEHERRVAEVFLATVDGVRVSTSCDFGGVGLTERACSTVLNAVLTRHADPLVTRCERVTREVMGDVPTGFARGDGGRALAPRMRAFPVAGLRATTACTLAGASLAGAVPDCRVVLLDGGMLRQGEVVAGLPVAVPGRPFIARTRLSVPTPKLGDLSPASLDGLLSDSDNVHLLALDQETLHPMVLRQDDSRFRWVSGEASALNGLAHCEPMAFVDKIAVVRDAEGVRRARAEAEEQALAMAVSGGGEPGTERIVESSAMVVPYGGAATVRLRVRSACGLLGK